MQYRIRFTAIPALLALFIFCLALGPSLWAQEPEKININEAGVEQLMELTGVGPVYADRIVTYRETHGPFEKPEDIMEVKGIGPRTFERNQDRISVGEVPENQ